MPKSGLRNRKNVSALPNKLWRCVLGERTSISLSVKYWYRLKPFFLNKIKHKVLPFFHPQQRELVQTMARANLRSLKPSERNTVYSTSVCVHDF